MGLPQDFCLWQICYYKIMKIEIGKIVKAQGIKGEVKMLCFVDDAEMLKSLPSVYVGTNCYAVQKVRADGHFCYLLLQGITDRNMAESLREWTVFADKENVILQKDRYFIDDLIGCKIVLDDGIVKGVVVDILQYGSADVYMCKGTNKDFSFPFLKDLIVSVDITSKTITLFSKRFDEVVVYED